MKRKEKYNIEIVVAILWLLSALLGWFFTAPAIMFVGLTYIIIKAND
ncbi:MAG: hypothetical protein GY861_29105 [bacterium]|nr:hypothetical protein [bacterium]